MYHASDFGFSIEGQLPSTRTADDEMQVRVVDVNGSEVLPFSVLQEARCLSGDDINHILSMWSEGRAAFIGEVEYHEVPSDPFKAA